MGDKYMKKKKSCGLEFYLWSDSKALELSLLLAVHQRCANVPLMALVTLIMYYTNKLIIIRGFGKSREEST